MKKPILSRNRLLQFFYCLCLILLANVSWGQTIYLDEPFTSGFPFPAASTQSSANNWTTNNGTIAANTNRTVISPLVYPATGTKFVNSGINNGLYNNYPGVSGNSSMSYRTFTSPSISSGTVYLSFIYQCTAKGGTNSQVIQLSDVTSNTQGATVWCAGDATNVRLGVTRSSSSTSDIQYYGTAGGTGSLVIGTNYLVVLKYDFSTNKAMLYINPTIGGSEPTEASANAFDDGSFGNKVAAKANFSYVKLNGSGANKAYFNISGMRITDSWSKAVAGILDTPTTSAATSIADTSFTANWGAVTNASSYTLTVYNSNGTVNQTIESIGSSATSSVVSSLTAGTSYYYKVTAIGNGTNFNDSTQSAASATVTTLASADPTITVSTTSLAAFVSSSAPKSFTVSGVYLVANAITITAPTNFQISLNSDSGYASSLTLNPSSGTVAGTTIYAKYTPTGTTFTNSGNIQITNALVATQNVSVSGSIDTYYYQSGSLASLSSWTAASDGTGINPTDFITAGITYKILKNATTNTDATWTVSGSGSKVVVGDLSVAPVTLTIASGFGITGIVNVAASNSSTAGNSIVVQNTTLPTFGALHATSEVHFRATMTVSTVPTDGLGYGKFYVDGGSAYTVTLGVPGNTIIQKLLMVDTGSKFVTSATSSNFITINSDGSATINGTLYVSKAKGLIVSTVNGSSGGAIGFLGLESLTLGTSSTIEYNKANNASTYSISPRTDYANLTITGLDNNKSLSGAASVSGTLTMNITGTSTFTGASFITLKDGATIVRTAGSFDTAPTFDTNVNLNYNGTTAITAGYEMPSSSTTVLKDLTVNNALGVTLASDVTLKGVLTLTSGVVATSANTLTISVSGSVSKTSGWVNGNLRKYIPAAATTATFEIGDASTNYTPVTTAFTGTISAATGSIIAKTTVDDHPNISSAKLYSTKSVNRYWTLTNDNAIPGLTFYAPTFTFVSGDIDGTATTANFKIKRYASSAWSATTLGSANSLNTSATGLTGFGDFAIGELIIPSISNTGSLLAFTTSEGVVSDYQSIAISGLNLNEGILVTPPTGFEVATSSDFSTIGTNSSPLTVGASGTVNSTTVYVRMQATTTVGSSPYAGSISLSSSDATSVSVTIPSSTVTSVPVPTVNVSATTLTAFAKTSAGKNSAISQNFVVNGINLGSNAITITPPTHFKISKTDVDADYSSDPIVLAPSSEKVLNTTIYVKYSPTGTGNLSGNTATISITNASVPSQTVSVTGNGLSTFYYNSGSLANFDSWKALSTGLGDSAPDFTTAGITYKILKNATTNTDATWTVSGSGSKVVVGDSSVAPVTLTIASGFAISGTIDASVSNSLSSGNSIVILEATNQPTFGLLDASSEVHYSNTITVANNSTAFGKLFIDGGAGKTYTLSAGAPIIKTSLTVTTGSTMAPSGNSGVWFYINDGATVTINGTFKAGKSNGFASFGVTSASSSYGSLQFNNSSASNLILGTSSTIEYNRSSAGSQPILGRTDYANLTISDGGSANVCNKTTTGNVVVSGIFTLNQPGSNTFSTNNNSLTVNGSLVLSAGTLIGTGNKVTLGDGATIFRTVGSFDAAPTFGTSVNLNYNGTTAITAGYEMPSSSTTVLNNLTVNNAAGVTLTTDITPKGALTLTSGVLTTGAKIINATGTVSRTAGWVNGNLQKNIATTGNVTFDVGDATTYSPAIINATAVTTAGNVVVAAKTGLSSQTNIGSMSLISSKSLNRYWSVTAPSFVGSYEGTYTFVSSDQLGTPTIAALGSAINTSGTTWVYPGTVTASTSTTVTAPTTSSFGDVVFAAKTPITITAVPKLKNVGDIDPALTYTTTGTLLGSDSFTGSLSRDAGEEGGTYAINKGTVTIAPSPANYDISYVGADLTINAPANPVSALAVSHRSNNIVRLTWTSPLGIYDNVLVFARATSVTHTPSGAGSAYANANAAIGSAGVYDTDNFLVYSGTGNSAEITGLTSATNYEFVAYSYKGSDFSAAKRISIVTTLQPVTSLSASFANAQSVLSWTNPTYNATQNNYWDEVVVLAKAGTISDVPSGDASTYTASATFGSGTPVGNSFVVYKGTGTTATITGLTNAITYNFKAYVRHGSVWSEAALATALPLNYVDGDYVSVANGLYSAASTWNIVSGTTLTAVGVTAPSANNLKNIWINGGYTVTLSANNSCKNLHVINGQLTGGLATSSSNSSKTLTVNENTVEVITNGTLGSNVGITGGDIVDQLAIATASTSTGTLKITGTGGVINIDRINNLGSGVTIEIDHDVTLNYHGSTNAGNAPGYASTTADNTLKINANKTLTFGPWSCLMTSTSGVTVPIYNYNVVVDGTLTLISGRPTGSTATPAFSTGTSFISLATSGSANFTVNAGGVVNAQQFYPNGNSNHTTATVVTTIINNGIINLADIVDLQKNSAQIITGTGVTNILSGATLKIGNPAGISTTASTGAIQTTGTNTYSTTANYEFGESLAQLTGNAFPSTVNNLTINNSAGVTLNASTTVNGTLALPSGSLALSGNTLSLVSTPTVTSGSINASIASSKVAFINSSPIVLPANLFSGYVEKLTINGAGGVTLGSSTSISGVLTVTSGAFNTAGYLTLKSSECCTATVAAVGGSISGTVTAERYIPLSQRAYRLLSSSVTTVGTINANWQEGGLVTSVGGISNPNLTYGTHITGAGGSTNGFDTTTNNASSIFTYDNASPAWKALTNTNGTLTAGSPYLIYIRGSRLASNLSASVTKDLTTLRATGTLKTGTVTLSGLNASLNGYSLIGNPYQAQVDMQAVLSVATNITTGFYYILEPRMGTKGQYVTVDVANNTNTSFGSSSANKYLQPWQACFVKTIAAGPASLAFLETNKYDGSSQTSVFRTKSGSSSRLSVSLYDTTTLAQNGYAVDGLIVNFDENGNNEIDENDALKMTNMEENMATANNGKLLSIERRTIPTDSEEIPLNITKYRLSNYTLKVEGASLTGPTPYLFDQYNNKTTEIPQDGTMNYAFSVNTAVPASIAADRFKIIYGKTLKIIDNAVSNFALYPNPSKTNSFSIMIPQSTSKASLTITNMLGQKLYSQNDLQTGTTLKISPNTVHSSGVYFVSVISDGNTSTTKWIVE